MQLWTPPTHRVFMFDFYSREIMCDGGSATPVTNTLFGAFFLALDRLQLSPGDGTGAGEGLAMVDPVAVECVLRHWTLGDSFSLTSLCHHPCRLRRS